jgi:hypothetical protein
MQQWQYLYVYADEMGRVQYISEEGCRKPGFYFSEGEKVYEFLSKLDLEGWELVTHTTEGGEFGENHFIFK